MELQLPYLHYSFRHSSSDDILYVDELSLCSNASTEESIDLDPTWEDVVNKPVEAVEMQARSTTDRCVGPTPPIHRVFKNPSVSSSTFPSLYYVISLVAINGLYNCHNAHPIRTNR